MKLSRKELIIITLIASNLITAIFGLTTLIIIALFITSLMLFQLENNYVEKHKNNSQNNDQKTNE